MTIQAISAMTQSLRPLDIERGAPMPCVLITYNEATGELTGTAYPDIGAAPHQRDLPDGEILVCKAPARLSEKDIAELVETAVAVYHKKKENGIL